MNRDAAAAATQRGRPRSEKAHSAILEAAAELLLERGLAAVSMDAVAMRAGVSKATIYRWWPTKETLALDDRLLHGHAPLNDRFVRDIIDTALDGIALAAPPH